MWPAIYGPPATASQALTSLYTMSCCSYSYSVLIIHGKTGFQYKQGFLYTYETLGWLYSNLFSSVLNLQGINQSLLHSWLHRWHIMNDKHKWIDLSCYLLSTKQKIAVYYPPASIHSVIIYQAPHFRPITHSSYPLYHPLALLELCNFT